MIAGLHANSEIRGFKRHKLTKIALVAIVLMPLLYSSLYLWAFWDPFGKVNDLPVALVNSDQGTTVEGEELNAGDKVVAGLHENDEISWIDTTSEEAQEGVANGKYYFSLELPENFSRAVASPSNSPNPQKAQLITTYNDANGYLSTMIGQNVMREVVNVVGDEISAEAVDKVLLGVVNAGTGLAQAADGAGQLADGTGQLRSGSSQLDDGAAQLKDGLGQAKSGSAQLASGAGELDSGLGQLYDGAGELSAGTNELATKVNSAAEKLGGSTNDLQKLTDGVNQLGAGAEEINGGVQQLKSKADRVTNFQDTQATNLRNIANTLRGTGDPIAIQSAAQLDIAATALEQEALGPESQNAADIARLAEGTAQLAYQLNNQDAPFRSGINQITNLPNQFGELQSGVNQLNDGAQTLHEKLGEAKQGAGQLASGAQQLDQGNAKLLDGATRLKQGTGEAVDGVAKLNDGANELHDRLEDGANQVPKWTDGQRVATAATIGGPVEMDSFNDSGTNTFGAGLAPFFFSLALFIGGILTFVLLKPLQARTVNSGVHSWRAAMDGYMPTGIIAALQAMVVVAVTVWGVGMKPDNLLGLLAFAMLVSMVYMAMNQMFNAVLGPGPGRVVSLAFLMLQVVASGGLYPVETQNQVFQWFHPFNPMTYAVNGFRQLIYGFYDERLPIAILVLLFFGALSMLGTTLAARKQRTWTMKTLHPALDA
ncbi:MAG TPA: YhgE/Pip domain-containing protein [Candidatus Corynebacterium gallistercoris]|uniref:YhgE/Pip domain-containing protein n=1 Tax=Candidatus Corynebacterium gallistercoris TaxID=2838530 RepID=A0A9D1RXL8_9CORY|nr:YhgE/Pip domain-containing protein [Candidatus Corynebacterium gallistercoris]